jgi:drug/metabolite transporter (DMT)-like permease
LNSERTFFKTFIFTALALVAFAANSVLCRLALGERVIDASGFTILRLISGIIVLLLILGIQGRKAEITSKGSWQAAVMLFLYAGAFSFAYITLDTGTGALILFAAVQLTMIIIALTKGDRLGIIAWSGILLAFGGFIYLVLPGVSAPSLDGFILMSIAGIAWGVYSILGKKSTSPLSDTAFNFTKTLPFIILLTLFTFPYLNISTKGIILAVLSGALASGVGYTIWYTALKELTATQASVVQLVVPVIAALGGVFFMSEIITLRLILSAVMILCGVAMVLLKKS